MLVEAGIKEKGVLFAGFLLALLCSGSGTWAQKFEAEDAVVTNRAADDRMVH